MAQRQKDDNGLLLLLLLLGLSGFKGITRPQTPDTSKPSPDTSKPSDSSPTDNTPADPLNPGKPTDKTGQGNAGDTPGTKTGGLGGAIVSYASNVGSTAQKMLMTAIGRGDNAGVQAAQAQINAINAGGFKQTGANTYVGNLPSPINNPLSSITTAVYNPKTGTYDTYTNNDVNHKSSPSFTPAPPMTQPTAPQRQPVGVPVPVVQPKPQSIPIPNLTGGVTQSANELYNMLLKNKNQGGSPSETVKVPNPTIPNTPGQNYHPNMGDTSIPNPLPQQPAFGQAFLNQFLQAGNSLQGAFNNLQGLIPNIPGLVSPRPLVVDVV